MVSFGLQNPFACRIRRVLAGERGPTTSCGVIHSMSRACRLNTATEICVLGTQTARRCGKYGGPSMSGRPVRTAGTPVPDDRMEDSLCARRYSRFSEAYRSSQQYRAAARQPLYNLGDSIRDPAQTERFRRFKAMQDLEGKSEPSAYRGLRLVQVRCAASVQAAKPRFRGVCDGRHLLPAINGASLTSAMLRQAISVRSSTGCTLRCTLLDRNGRLEHAIRRKGSSTIFRAELSPTQASLRS
jgi:hypothetical protein